MTNIPGISIFLLEGLLFPFCYSAHLFKSIIQQNDALSHDTKATRAHISLTSPFLGELNLRKWPFCLDFEPICYSIHNAPGPCRGFGECPV
jgi:hypothetical protein